MRFSAWPFLLLLALIPFLHRLWSERNRPARVSFSIPIPAAIGRRNPTRLLLGLKDASLAFMIIPLARPQTSFKETVRTVSGVDIMMLLDVSASMNAEDMAENTSRLDV